MIKTHVVPFSLSISVASFLLFLGFSVFVNEYSESYERKIDEVRRENTYAKKRLQIANQKIINQKRKADSLEVIVEAQKREEIVWLARGIYSETKKPHEMWYVGWVIRNRFDSRFRNSGTYKSVILHPKQFSAFNKGNPLRNFYLRLKPEHVGQALRWHDALAIAKRIIESPKKHRPISRNTLYFYSKRSMAGEPNWKYSLYKVDVPEVKDRRFAFFREPNISSSNARANNGR